MAIPQQMIDDANEYAEMADYTKDVFDIAYDGCLNGLIIQEARTKTKVKELIAAYQKIVAKHDKYLAANGRAYKREVWDLVQQQKECYEFVIDDLKKAFSITD